MTSNRLLVPPISVHTTVSQSGISSSHPTDMSQPLDHDTSATSPDSDDGTTNISLSLRVPSSPARSLGGSTLRSRTDSFNSEVETARSRATSVNSTTETARSRKNSDVQTIRPRFEGDDLSAEEALRPGKTDQKDFEVANNPFAFSPGQLNKTRDPKSLAAYRALGGLRGLERGLKTDVIAGLSVDEVSISEKISFEEATQSARTKKTVDAGTVFAQDVMVTDHEVKGQYHDRIRVFKDNRLPTKKSLSIWKLFWNAFNDRVLIILTVAAVVSLALGIYEATGQTPAPGQGPSLDWVEGLAIEVAVVIVVLVTGLNDYRREKQFVALNRKKRTGK